METTIRINTDLLGMDFVEGIKKMFPHKEVEIIIHPSDETEYIESNPAYKRELLERINNYEKNNKTISVRPDELI